jgi:hypothetical protein
MAFGDEMQVQGWGLEIQQQPIHENHEEFELSADNGIYIGVGDSEFEDGDVVTLATDPVITLSTDPVVQIVVGRVTKNANLGSRQGDNSRWMKIDHALGMNEARWKLFIKNLKKKCSGGDCHLSIMGVAKSQDRFAGEGITLSVERRESEPSNIDADDDSDNFVHKAAVEALQAALAADSDDDDMLGLDQVSEVLIGLDDNPWLATDAKYNPYGYGAAVGATTHVSHVSSVEIMRSKSGRETIEFRQVEMGYYYGLTYNDDDGNVKQQRLNTVFESLGKADRSAQLFVSVYDTASKTKMCNHVRVDKIRKCKNGYRLYLEENQIASTTMTGKSKQGIVTLYCYGYNQELPGQFGKRLGTKQNPVWKVEPEDWEGGLRISLEGNVGQAFQTMQVFFLSNGRKTVLATVKSVEYDGSKTMVTMEDRPLSMSGVTDNCGTDNWACGFGFSADALWTIKGIPMAMPAKPSALKLTLTDAFLVQDPVDIADAINKAIQESDKGISLADIDDLLDESGQGGEYGVTGVDVFNGLPGLAQTRSSVARELGVTISSSSSGKRTCIDIDQGSPKALVFVYKSALNDSGVKDEETSDESLALGLQLENMRQGFGEDRKGFAAHVTIVGVDGVVKCDRERVSKVLRKKKGGRCIYRLVVDHGNKVKTTHPGKRCDCTMYLDEIWGAGF